MNINNVPEVEDYPENIWLAIRDRQLELMKKYHGIEKSSGLLQTEEVPVKIDTSKGQARLKDFCWRTTEEITESFESHLEGHKQHTVEEISDALHFMTELMILTGLFEDHEFRPMGVIGVPSRFNIAQKTDEAMYFQPIYYLGLAANLLKLKPWKQTFVATDRFRFKDYLQMAHWSIYELFKWFGYDDKQIYDIYFRKSEVNKFRQRSNY